MGVARFFRWLTSKYPNILYKFLESKSTFVDGMEIPVDSTKPNPNGVEFDCLYLDLNGLVHPCCHPEGREAPATEHDMYLAVFKELDRIFAAARPRKLLFMALDGVAPRAKQNQQRARRFKAAREAKDAEEDAQKLRNDIARMGRKPPPPGKPHWDHNVITPGTGFMDKLSKYLRFYIHQRMTYDAAWKDVTVVFSDSNTPGEGEHKIMEFIRLQRTQPGYDPNMTHVIHGLDADLIMLALATHEVNFYILREEVVFGRQAAHKEVLKTAKATALLDGQRGFGDETDGDGAAATQKPLEILSVAILRECLGWEFREEAFSGNFPFPYDLERVIDDFVFLCFFVGNDFLPHLPSLDISEGALDLLMDLYRRRLPTMSGYLSNNGDVDLQNASIMLSVVGNWEDEIFKKRQAREEANKKRRQYRQMNEKAAQGINKKDPKRAGSKHTMTRLDAGLSAMAADAAREFAVALGSKKSKKKSSLKRPAGSAKKEKEDEAKPGEPQGDDGWLDGSDEEGGDEKAGKGGSAAASKDKGDTSAAAAGAPPQKGSDATAETVTGEEEDPEAVEETEEERQVAFKTKLKELNRARTIRDDIEDSVRLGEQGWKQRYYLEKFGDRIYEKDFSTTFWGEYTKGLCWVLAYYYKGCASWSWYYPYHYAPFASDLRNLEQYYPITFEKSEPFSPISQLMAVLPPRSNHCMPVSCRALMEDSNSSIIDFYPEKFEYDPNGKSVSWLWVVLLPFLDEKRLLDAIKEVDQSFTAEEKARDELVPHTIYAHFKSEVGKVIEEKVLAKEDKGSYSVESAVNGVVGGKLMPLEQSTGLVLPHFQDSVKPPDAEKSLTTIKKTSVQTSFYEFPEYKTHINRILPGAKIPPPSLEASQLNSISRVPRGFGGRHSIAYLAQNEARDQQRMGGGGQRSWGSAEPRRKKMRYSSGPRPPAPSSRNPYSAPPNAYPGAAYPGSYQQPQQHYPGYGVPRQQQQQYGGAAYPGAAAAGGGGYGGAAAFPGAQQYARGPPPQNYYQQYPSGNGGYQAQPYPPQQYGGGAYPGAGNSLPYPAQQQQFAYAQQYHQQQYQQHPSAYPPPRQ
jgi:5'-3' exoribonuclease 2